MAYSHYRRNAPGWGTQQFQLGAPPVPNYQPLPTWTGQDFYSAHAMGGDPMLYQNTISRLSSGLGGVGIHEANNWHRRAYAGLGEVTRMLPQEIGAAAAYEAYRQVKYGSGTYQFLHGDYERQREAMEGLAIAEVVRLWQDTGRAVDQYGLQVACDGAAATVNRIITQREVEDVQGFGMGFGTGSYRDRRNSFNAYPTSGYASSTGIYGGTSTLGGGSPLIIGGNIPASPMITSAIPVPGSPFPPIGSGVSYIGNPDSIGMPMSYGGKPGRLFFGRLYRLANNHYPTSGESSSSPSSSPSPPPQAAPQSR
ncbi:hypothetical protein B0F90DRAFT_1668147 [Multifurca ochricompacta]|uniref:Uncharacterized protein n=1 Tax=Multifurca ochricompacta TaxID=376703 RepID=A0AAD4M4J1_9AGAM|nr:hypothetical protein B0F90DRAFT_1668147 [Multifurca ochricompacta]